MSSILNIAAVSETLSAWLHAKVTNLDGAPKAQVGRLESLTGTGQLVNVYLYEVTKNVGYLGNDLPTRNPQGALTRKPLVAVDLHYLITFFAADELHSQILLGTVVRAIHAHGGLTRDQLKSTIDNTALLKGATVDTQQESIRLALRPIAIDEMSKLWGMFPKCSYITSIGVTATTVILEADVEPESTLPVQSLGVTPMPFTEPRIESIAAVNRLKGVVFDSDKLIVLGHQLTSADLTLKTDTGAVLKRETLANSPNGIVWTLPAEVPAGIRSLAAEKPTESGRSFSSSEFPFILRPQITAISKTPDGKTLNLTVTPKLKADQQSVAVLTKLDDNNVYWTLPISGTGNKVTAPLTGVTAGKYMVRFRVDGAESLLTYDNSPDKVVELLVVA